MQCTNFTVGDWKSLNLVRSIAATLGALIILAILSFSIYLKAYSSLFQRLYLYLMIATLLNEISGIISVEHQWQYEHQETACVYIGFFTAWSYVLLFIYSYEIIIYLLYLVVSKMRGIQQCVCGPGCTFCYSATTEIVYILLPVLISTAFSLPPYIQKKFGIAGPWCFVRSLNRECEPTGLVMQMTFYGMYMFLGVAGIVASLVFLIVYCKLANHFKEVRYLLKRTLYVLLFKFVHILLILCSVACRIYTLKTRRHQIYGLWLLHALSVPLGVLVFPLGYFLCFNPVGAIVQTVYKKIARKWVKRYLLLNPTEEQSLTFRATAQTSDRMSQPSYTSYEVPHPSEVSRVSERSPEKSITGYGCCYST